MSSKFIKNIEQLEAEGRITRSNLGTLTFDYNNMSRSKKLILDNYSINEIIENCSIEELDSPNSKVKQSFNDEMITEFKEMNQHLLSIRKMVGLMYFLTILGIVSLTIYILISIL